MSAYQNDIKAVAALKEAAGAGWSGISEESVARMRAQNKFKTGLDIAKYTAKIMREDMAAYDADSSQYTQSLGCWHGFIGQQKLISIKKHFNSTDRRYLYLSGWMIAALRSEFGPLPDQSMHEKTTVSGLIAELYTFLRQADARELGGLFRQLDTVAVKGKKRGIKIYELIDDIDVHVDQEKVALIRDFEKGVQLYRKREFQSAFDLFEQLQNNHPEDLSIKLYIERCENFITNPPPADWDGVFQIEIT